MSRRKPRKPRRRAAEVTADRLEDHLYCFPGAFANHARVRAVITELRRIQVYNGLVLREEGQ